MKVSINGGAPSHHPYHPYHPYHSYNPYHPYHPLQYEFRNFHDINHPFVETSLYQYWLVVEPYPSEKYEIPNLHSWLVVYLPLWFLETSIDISPTGNVAPWPSAAWPTAPGRRSWPPPALPGDVWRGKWRGRDGHGETMGRPWEDADFTKVNHRKTIEKLETVAIFHGIYSCLRW